MSNQKRTRDNDGGCFRKLVWKPVRMEMRAALEKISEDEDDPLLAAFLSAGLKAPSVHGQPTPAEEFHILLQSAAEIEQALMVQYLYALFSAQNANPTEAAFRPIAIQEMGHLFSVQNVLRVLGYDVHLDLPTAENPEAKNTFPFPLVLQPASIASLAQYVTAESPLKELLPEALRIPAEAAEQDAGIPVNHVGILFLKLYWMMQPTSAAFGPLKLSAGWIEVFGDRHVPEPNSNNITAQRSWNSIWDVLMSDENYLENSSENELFVGQITGDVNVGIREQICRLIYSISTQGEGAVTDDNVDSHFETFVALYQNWKTQGIPEGIALAATNPWIGEPSEDPIEEARRITHPESVVLAQAFNLRYERLVLLIAVTFTAEVPQTDSNLILQIRSQALKAMRRDIANLAESLMSRPLKDGLNEDENSNAGPPFWLASKIPTGLALIRQRLGEILEECKQLKADNPGLAEITNLDLSLDEAMLQQLPAA